MDQESRLALLQRNEALTIDQGWIGEMSSYRDWVMCPSVTKGVVEMLSAFPPDTRSALIAVPTVYAHFARCMLKIASLFVKSVFVYSLAVTFLERKR